MSCENVQELISSLLDPGATEKEREYALAHIESCRGCGAQYEATQGLRASLRELDRVEVPVQLQQELRVIASHARVRQLARVNWSARFASVNAKFQLFFDNLMRPLALPFAGGIMSAILLFAMWVPTMGSAYSPVDVTAPIYTPPDWQRQPAMVEGSSGADIAVTLLIDERGNVADYYVSGGKFSPELTHMILFSKFKPATLFGHPTWGKVVFTRSEIKVKG
jgi:hypothetical protein